MSTLSSYAPAYPTPPPERDGADFEPDDEWKRKLKQDIEQRFKSMVQEARDNQQVQLMEGNVNREELDHEYKRTLHNIKGLAEEQYQLALMTERNERRWIAGVQMLPGWNDVLHEEQKNIMNSIKQSNHSDNSARAAESRIDEQGTNGSLTSTAASAPRRGSESQSSDPPPTREAPVVYDRARSRTFSSPSSTTASQKDPPLPPATRYQIGGRESTPSIHKKENIGRSKEELTRREAEFNPLQPQFRKRTEEIKHTRAKERKHQDPSPVIGSESWDRSQMKKMEEQLEEDELSSTSEEESEHDRHDGDSEEDDDDEVHVKARELEAELQRLQRTRREADVKIQALALEFRRLKEEERRMENEARKADEEVRQKEELRPKELWEELELWREETELQWEEELELQREEELRLQREEEPRLQWEEELELQQALLAADYFARGKTDAKSIVGMKRIAKRNYLNFKWILIVFFCCVN